MASNQSPLLIPSASVVVPVPDVCILSELLALSLALPTDLENDVTGFFLELLFDPLFKLEFAMVFFRFYRDMQLALLINTPSVDSSGGFIIVLFHET
jgi:hypothetical protein